MSGTALPSADNSFHHSALYTPPRYCGHWALFALCDLYNTQCGLMLIFHCQTNPFVSVITCISELIPQLYLISVHLTSRYLNAPTCKIMFCCFMLCSLFCLSVCTGLTLCILLHWLLSSVPFLHNFCVSLLNVILHAEGMLYCLFTWDFKERNFNFLWPSQCIDSVILIDFSSGHSLFIHVSELEIKRSRIKKACECGLVDSNDGFCWTICSEFETHVEKPFKNTRGTKWLL